MPNQTPPLVSVIMPVYNGARFLRAAIDSILNQTWRDVELIIVDDGSTDETPAMLAEYAARDARIRVETYSMNRGIVAALNHGCALAQGRYLARMDADDISLPERLSIQVACLDRHPEIGVVGASIQWIDEHNTPGALIHPPASPGLIRWRAFFTSPMAHSTIMMRKTVFERAGGYVEGMAQDYNLWLRISAISDLANLPDVLLRYRVWEGSITSQHSARTNATSAELAQHSISTLLGDSVPYEMAAALRAVMVLDKSTWPDNPAAIRATAAWLVRVCRMYVTGNGPSRLPEVKTLRQDSKKLLKRLKCYLAHTIPAPLVSLRAFDCLSRTVSTSGGKLSRAEVRIIKGEVAFRLVLLALRVFRSAPHTSVRLMITALRLYPWVVGRIVAKIGFRAYLYIRFSLPFRRTNSPSPSRMGRGPGGGADQKKDAP